MAPPHSHPPLSFLPPSPTADGWLQRVVILGSEAHVIEEIQLFESPQPVDSLTISHTKVTHLVFVCVSPSPSLSLSLSLSLPCSLSQIGRASCRERVSSPV